MSSQPSRPTLVELLAGLFAATTDPGGRVVTAKEIVHRTRRVGPGEVGESYFSQLRSGVAATPSFRTVEALAAAFEVDIAYFTADFHHHFAHATMTDRVWRARADRTNHYHQLVLAMADLPRQQHDDITTLINVLYDHEHTRCSCHAS
ncbi:XRE family transcriptional regulator [Gordonia sp. CPCC 205333]|uniref:XRE family transcriptional regulator n=1 Tax=Gordonia sp. CPCC 205333 TaxID=3140790 RepID=UPI003AF3DA74